MHRRPRAKSTMSLVPTRLGSQVPSWTARRNAPQPDPAKHWWLCRGRRTLAIGRVPRSAQTLTGCGAVR